MPNLTSPTCVCTSVWPEILCMDICLIYCTYIYILTKGLSPLDTHTKTHIHGDLCCLGKIPRDRGRDTHTCTFFHHLLCRELRTYVYVTVCLTAKRCVFVSLYGSVCWGKNSFLASLTFVYTSVFAVCICLAGFMCKSVYRCVLMQSNWPSLLETCTRMSLVRRPGSAPLSVSCLSSASVTWFYMFEWRALTTIGWMDCNRTELLFNFSFSANVRTTLCPNDCVVSALFHGRLDGNQRNKCIIHNRTDSS